MTRDLSQPSPSRHEPEEVEAALNLTPEDRDDLPGLYQLNAVRVPAFRAVGYPLLLGSCLLHNWLLFGDPRWDLWVPFSLLVALWVVASGWALRRFFAPLHRRHSVHLGHLFITLDLGFFAGAVGVTGGPESYLWPIFLVRVADQMWIGRGRTFRMILYGMVTYLALLLLWEPVTGEAVRWAGAWLELWILLGVGLYMTFATKVPLDLRDRTVAAKEWILRLEEQSEELNRARQRAEEANRAKTEFLQRMSHELRTPLNSVIGFTNVLLRNRGLGMDTRELDYLQRVRQNGVHLLAMINDLLDLSRLELGDFDIRESSVDLEDLVGETVRQLEGRVLGSEVKLEVSVPADLKPLRADEVRMRQVLINLIGNAIKFTERGAVTVEVEARARRPVAVHVRDTGIGIPQERLDQIFGAFEQADGSTTRRHAGTGLGLAIARQLCAAMGFTLVGRGEPGEGSTFSILLRPEEGTEAPGPLAAE